MANQPHTNDPGKPQVTPPPKMPGDRDKQADYQNRPDQQRTPPPQQQPQHSPGK
jgi:hypothetical protein